MSINIEVVKEITENNNPYKLFIYKSLDYISTEELITIDPRLNASKFYDVPKIGYPLLYEYPSDGVTKFTVMVLYKIMNDDDSAVLSTVFRADDYYDSALFTKMKINIVVKGIIKDEFTISQIKVQLFDHNNAPYTIHDVDGQLDANEQIITNGLITPSLTAMNPNKIHYNKDLTRLIKSVKYLNPKVDMTVMGSNVIIDNNTIRKVAYVNVLEDGDSPIIYNNDYVGQILGSANVLSANAMQNANILRCNGLFVDIDTYPELYAEIGDLYLFDVELWVKIVEVGGAVTEITYDNAVSTGKEDLIVELFNVQNPVASQNGKFKLPSKEHLGFFDNYEYYIKFQTSINTLNAKLITSINGVGIFNNTITLNTTDIPQGNNLYYQDSVLDPVRDRLDDLEGQLTSQPVLSVAGVRPYLVDDNTDPLNPQVKGDVPLTANDIGAVSQQYIQDLILEINLQNYLNESGQLNKIYTSYYEQGPLIQDPENPDDPEALIPAWESFKGFHIDSSDIYYEKELTTYIDPDSGLVIEDGRNPNDPSYIPQSIHDVIEGILDELANNNVSKVIGESGDVILTSGDIDLDAPVNSQTDVQSSLVDLNTRINAVNYPVTSVNTKTGTVVLVQSDIPSIGTTYQLLMPTADIDANSHKVINLITGTTNTDAVNKLQMDTADNLRALKSAIVQIPIIDTVVNNGVLSTLNLGTPSLLSGSGVVGDYISVTTNIIKVLKLQKQLQFSGLFLANFASETDTTREYEFLISRPATVDAPGTVANDIVHRNNRIKTTGTAVADTEFSFKTSFVGTSSDPFFIDGFVLRLNNISGSNMTSSTTRAGTSTISELRILFLD